MGGEDAAAAQTARQLTLSGSFEIAHFSDPAPKGPQQISPGQRPGLGRSKLSVALNGHNKPPRDGVLFSPTGLASFTLPQTQGVALG